MPPDGWSMEAPLVVFTDLDGTLLDARSYSADPARDALSLLAVRGVPVVFCSSKTAAEQRSLRTELGVTGAPFIVENGAAVLVPAAAGLPVADWPVPPGGAGEHVRVLGRTSTEVRAGIGRAAKAAGLAVTGYADLPVSAVAALTGLEPAAAARARQREFSETLVDDFSPDKWTRLETALAVEGLSCRHGGRFRTVTAAETDKGRAVRMVAALYAMAAGRAPVTAGLGDSANDEGMLAAVDRPYLLTSADGTWVRLEVPRLRRIPRPGPQGWHEAILDLLAT